MLYGLPHCLFPFCYTMYIMLSTQIQHSFCITPRGIYCKFLTMQMGYRLLTYLTAAVICFFLSFNKEAEKETHADIQDIITQNVPASFFSQHKAACSPPRPTGCSAPLRHHQQAKRTSAQKIGSSCFIKSGKTHNNFSISPLLNCSRRFPSGFEEPSHKFIRLRKLVI